MQELLQDINALRRGIEALNKRSLEQGKPVSRAELDEVLAKVKQEVRFTINYQALPRPSSRTWPRPRRWKIRSPRARRSCSR
ncbi:hypothetical protein [Hymenobacter sp. AT01-02]|uniref:hypothetical protein n=1 Tax=Hymenobacter sp. AT01-02 TaxID=1571877 RepID=UPI000B266064|nr:hypothetical protein [Hymenobacter sp. AT01-02]